MPLNKPRVYLHVGLHKTGTTSIQLALTKSRQELRQSGVLYPLAGVPEWARFGHHLLAWSMVTRPEYMPYFNGNRASFTAEQREQLWADLHDEIGSANGVRTILSSEEFDSLDAGEIAALGARLAPYDVTPIIFIRNYVDLIESSFRTSVVHSNYVKDASAFASNQRTRLDFVGMIRDWSSIAVGGETLVMSYDDPAIGRDSIAVFLDAVGIKAELLPSQARSFQNESLPAYLCEIVRFMRSKGTPEAPIRDWIEQMRRVAVAKPPTAKYLCMPDPVRQDLESRYADEVARLEGDPAISGMLRGKLARTPRPGTVVVVDNIVQALLALGRETMRKET